MKKIQNELQNELNNIKEKIYQNGFEIENGNVQLDNIGYEIIYLPEGEIYLININLYKSIAQRRFVEKMIDTGYQGKVFVDNFLKVGNGSNRFSEIYFYNGKFDRSKILNKEDSIKLKEISKEFFDKNQDIYNSGVSQF